MKTNYKDYFRDHYGSNFSQNEVFSYQAWFLVQYNFFSRKLRLRESIKNLPLFEIGSGTGGFYSLLSEEEKMNYKGIELDTEAVRFSNNFFQTDVFSDTDLKNFKCDQRFGRIFAFEVLEHLQNPIESIEKIYYLLESDGVFVGTSPYPYKKNIFADETHLHVLHPENWKRLFLNCGFTSVEIYPMSFFPFFWRLNSRLNVRIPFYIPFPGFISTTLIIAKK